MEQACRVVVWVESGTTGVCRSNQTSRLVGRLGKMVAIKLARLSGTLTVSSFDENSLPFEQYMEGKSAWPAHLRESSGKCLRGNSTAQLGM